MFPSSEDDYIRYKILLPTVIQPGKDIVVTMSAPVMHKLRELTPQKPKTVIPDLQSLVVEKEEIEESKQEITKGRKAVCGRTGNRFKSPEKHQRIELDGTVAVGQC